MKSSPPGSTVPLRMVVSRSEKEKLKEEQIFAAGDMLSPNESLLAAASYMFDFENIIKPGKEPSMLKEYKPKVASQMEKYLDPQTLKQHVMRSEKMHKLIAYYAAEANCPPKQIEQQAQIIIDEIGLDRNMAIIRSCCLIITTIAQRISTGIYVNSTNMERVKQSMGSNPVLYLPSHRSYLDYILLAYVSYTYDIEIPAVAAGMDFHSMFAMGTMLRKTGAFFMRRSFSNDELYWDIFREYMYALITHYHIGVEFFIEGTRSRNFKSLVPKVGLLSMALLPYFAGEVSDITVVPISFSYERVLEEELFVYELLGVPKPKESTKGFFKALKIVEENFGKMYMDFGKPISVREFFKQTTEERMHRGGIGAHLQKLNRNEIELIKRLANEVVYQQQRNIVIFTFNMLSLQFASRLYAKYSINMDELARGILQLMDIFEELGAHVATNRNAIKAEIIEAVEIHLKKVHFHEGRLQFTKIAATELAQQIDSKHMKAHSLKPQTMAIAVPALSLQLYINPCLFWLARPSFLILAALAEQEKRKQRKITAGDSNYESQLKHLFEHVGQMDAIFKHEFIVESYRDEEEFKRNFEILQKYGVLGVDMAIAQVIVHKNECCCAILSALAPFLCLYYQLVVTLNSEFPIDTEFTNKDILVKVQERIEVLLQQKDALYVHPYCLALDNLNIALQSFLQEGYLNKNKDTSLLSHSLRKSLRSLEIQLLEYCQLMPFVQYNAISTKEVPEWLLPSKL